MANRQKAVVSPLQTYIGLMSGTSLDGIDAALLSTDGQSRISPGPALFQSYDEPFRDRLRAQLGAPTAPPDLIAELTRRHAVLVEKLLAHTDMPPAEVRAIGFHGQTIHHDPGNRLTVQIGDPAALARMLLIDVVGGIRLADVEAGGQGAPVAPIYHQALMKSAQLPAVMVNIGGVANLTWTDGDRLLAFDCGPGNALIDDWVREKTGARFDADGRLAGSGTIHEDLIAKGFTDPIFDRKPPCSLDRRDLRLHGLGVLSTEDGAATLAAFTADAIVRAGRWFPAEPKRWILTGGGRLNRAITTRLQAKLSRPVVDCDSIGMDGDALEAHMMAYLAARSLNGLPITFPQTTGVSAPMTGGVFYSSGDHKSAISST